MLRFRLSISESCEELDIVLKVERQFDTQTTAHFNSQFINNYNCCCSHS